MYVLEKDFSNTKVSSMIKWILEQGEMDFVRSC